MLRKSPTCDPARDYRRKAVAARNVGAGARCSCGEDRPPALIAGSNPTICAECQRAGNKRALMDDHHFAGRANNPATISVPVNDHRAVLSAALVTDSIITTPISTVPNLPLTSISCALIT